MFNINGEDWNVILVEPYDPEMFRSDGTLTIGVCDDRYKTIFINNRLNDADFKTVLCHEIVHAAMFSYNVELSEDQEELVANLIAIYGDEIIEITNAVFKILRKRKG